MTAARTTSPPEVENIFREYVARLLLGERPSNPNLMLQVPEEIVAGFSPEFKLLFEVTVDDLLLNKVVDPARVGQRLNGGGSAVSPILVELVSDFREGGPTLSEIEERIQQGVARFEETRGKREQANAALEFPDGVMTGVAGAFAEVYSSVLEPPAQFFFFSFLVCVGMLVTGRVTLASEIAPPIRFFLLLLGESADDRKSTAIKQTVAFFRRFVTEFPVCWGVGSAEGLQAALAESPRLLLALDEMKAFVSKCRIEGSVLLQAVTSLFENTFYQARTKTTSVKLEGAHLSILGASTIGTFETMFGSAFIDIGFLNRLWLVSGGGVRRFSIPGKIPERDLLSLGLMLGEMLKLATEAGEMAITPEARALFDQWYLGLDQSVHSKRLDTYALRLMPLLAINDGRREVDVDTVGKTILLCNHQLKVRQLYDPVDSDNKIAGIEEKIRRVIRAKGYATERTLKRAVHIERVGLWAYDQARQNLLKAKEIRFDSKAGVYSAGGGAR